MNFLILIIIIGVAAWAIADYIKINRELRRCPQCGQIVTQKFTLKQKGQDISPPQKSGEKLGVTIYKCSNCGNSWNHTYEYNENAG